MKADVICENDKCPNKGKIVNTVTFPMVEQELFYEAFGHGSEDPEDFCKECGTLGILKEPDLEDVERRHLIEVAREALANDDIEIEDDAKVSIGGDPGVWVQGWLWVPEFNYRDMLEGLPPKCECDNTHEQNDTVCRWCWAHGRRKWNDPEVKE